MYLEAIPWSLYCFAFQGRNYCPKYTIRDFQMIISIWEVQYWYCVYHLQKIFGAYVNHSLLQFTLWLGSVAAPVQIVGFFSWLSSGIKLFLGWMCLCSKSLFPQSRIWRCCQLCCDMSLINLYLSIPQIEYLWCLTYGTKIPHSWNFTNPVSGIHSFIAWFINHLVYISKVVQKFWVEYHMQCGLVIYYFPYFIDRTLFLTNYGIMDIASWKGTSAPMLCSGHIIINCIC